MGLEEVKIVDFSDNDNLLEKIGVTDFHKKYNKGEGIKVLIIDSGLEEEHPEITSNISLKYNGLERNYNVKDDSGHGTHVTSIISGVNIGIAPMVEIGIIKALSLDGGSHLSVMDALSLAIQYEYDILCLSLGTYQEPPMLFKNKIHILSNKNITVCCATGNDSDSNAMFPAQLSTTIAVGGLDENLSNIATYSNKGYDILAPSFEIFGAYKDSQYARMTGTSMANPIVVGLIALIKSFCKSNNIVLSEKKLKDLLIEEKYIHKDFLNNIIDKIKAGA